MHEFETVSGSGSRACMHVRLSQALAAEHFLGRGDCKTAFSGAGRLCKSIAVVFVSWPPRLVDFLISSLYGNHFLHPSYGGPRLWQQGMHEIEKVSSFGSRVCMKFGKSQALAVGHA